MPQKKLIGRLYRLLALRGALRVGITGLASINSCGGALRLLRPKG